MAKVAAIKHDISIRFACQVMFKFPVYIDINELLGQFMSISSTYQSNVSIFCYFFDISFFMCWYTRHINSQSKRLTKTEFWEGSFKAVRHPLGLLGQFGQRLNSRHLGTNQHCPYGICYLGHYVNSGAASYLYPQKAARSGHLSAVYFQWSGADAVVN